MADDAWLDELIDSAQQGGVQLTGQGGFLPEMIKAVLERGLAAELTDHLGYEHGDPAGRGSPNSRNGFTPKTVSTEIGPVPLDVPRDRASTFEPRLVPKGQRRLGGLDEQIISLYAGGMTVRDIQAHLSRTLGTELSHDTISKVTDAVLDEVKAWQSRPLEERRIPVIVVESFDEGIAMPRYAWNKMSSTVKYRYFELIRQGLSGAEAARRVGVSLSCGSLWFIDAGGVSFVEVSISARYLSQDDRIAIADGLARGEQVKLIALRIGRSYQTVYREIARNRKPDGRYQPWYAHSQAHVRRRRPKLRRFAVDSQLRELVAGKLGKRWSPGQISRWLRRRFRRRPGWHVCTETIYDAVYRGLISPTDRRNLRTGRMYRHRHGRGRSRDGALKQSTKMKSIHQRPAVVESRRQAGHWEGDLPGRCGPTVSDRDAGRAQVPNHLPGPRAWRSFRPDLR